MFMLANSTLFMLSTTRPFLLAEVATGKKRDLCMTALPTLCLM